MATTSALAASPSVSTGDGTEPNLIQQIIDLRDKAQEIMNDKCRPPYPVGYERPGNIPEVMREWVRDLWAERVKKAKKLASKCLAYPYGVWDRLAICETSGNWQHNSGTYQGGLGFYHGSWDQYNDFGYPSEAYLATREQQIRVAISILNSVGWGAWPACSIRLGLR